MIEATVSGMKFTKPPMELWIKLEKDVELKLEREKDNQYDENAIKVMFDDFHLGYVNKETAKHLSPVMDEGTDTEAIITRVFGTPEDRPHIEMAIMLNGKK